MLKSMLDITVIILTYNEEIHIERCIEKIKPIASNIFIVDSFSSDKTPEIARRLGAKVFQNKWENNYAKQFNWGLNNLPIITKWVLRLDADEYLNPELIEELQQKLGTLTEDITGVVFKRRHIFLGKWIKRGTYPVKLLRLFQYKKGFCEQRWMDEHIHLQEGKAIEFHHDFTDHNLNNISWWTKKHINYAIREAIDLLDVELGLGLHQSGVLRLNEQAAKKRLKKLKYVNQPLFWRSSAYFIYRYILKFGFLEGKEGFLWHFMQGWWYRTLVDLKIWEIRKFCGLNKDKIKVHIEKEYNIKL